MNFVLLDAMLIFAGTGFFFAASIYWTFVCWSTVLQADDSGKPETVILLEAA